MAYNFFNLGIIGTEIKRRLDMLKDITGNNGVASTNELESEVYTLNQSITNTSNELNASINATKLQFNSSIKKAINLKDDGTSYVDAGNVLDINDVPDVPDTPDDDIDLDNYDIILEVETLKSDLHIAEDNIETLKEDINTLRDSIETTHDYINTTKNNLEHSIDALQEKVDMVGPVSGSYTPKLYSSPQDGQIEELNVKSGYIDISGGWISGNYYKIANMVFVRASIKIKIKRLPFNENNFMYVSLPLPRAGQNSVIGYFTVGQSHAISDNKDSCQGVVSSIVVDNKPCLQIRSANGMWSPVWEIGGDPDWENYGWLEFSGFYVTD